VIELLASGVVLLILDQSMKSGMLWLDAGKGISRANLPFVCRGWQNGQAWREQSLRPVLLAFWIWAMISAMVLHYSLGWFQSRASLAGIGFALGGAAGNLLDVWRHRGVIDFIDVGWWPAFNLADVGIVGGLLMAFLS
jgi:lipoprotein signal peptidase